jgi:hypothetical protein
MASKARKRVIKRVAAGAVAKFKDNPAGQELINMIGPAAAAYAATRAATFVVSSLAGKTGFLASRPALMKLVPVATTLLTTGLIWMAASKVRKLEKWEQQIIIGSCLASLQELVADLLPSVSLFLGNQRNLYGLPAASGAFPLAPEGLGAFPLSPDADLGLLPNGQATRPVPGVTDEDLQLAGNWNY